MASAFFIQKKGEEMIEIRNINQAVEVAKNYTNNELIKEILFSTFCLEQNIESKKLENKILG